MVTGRALSSSVVRFRIRLQFRSNMSDSEGETYEKQVKIVLVGDGSSGKVKSLGIDFVCLSNLIPSFSDIDIQTIFERFISLGVRSNIRH